jgi:flagellar basal-body rod protein FlgB
MELNDLTLFKVAKRRLAYLGERHRVLAENVSNSDTPDYRPRDLKPLNFKALIRDERRGMGPAVTHPVHLEGPRRPMQFGMEKPRTYETAPNGNQVILEEQMLKVAEVQSQYQLATNLYQKNLGMLRTAIGRPGQ